MTKRIRFVAHWTVKTGSDHRALFVHVQIRRRRKGPWVDVLLVSVNMGGRFRRADLNDLIAIAADTGIPAVFCFQEASDQPWLQAVLEQHGYTYVGGSGKAGQAATPMGVDDRIDITKTRWRKLLEKLFIGKGAGPDHNKDKWWARVRFELEQVPFGVTSWHAIASQQNRLRMWAARLQAGRLVRVLTNLRWPYFAVGDENSDDDQPLSAWLRRRGTTTNHRELGEIATHHNRSIDVVRCAARLVARKPRRKSRHKENR